MGSSPTPRARGRTSLRTTTIHELIRWEEHGATWRPLQISDEEVTLELCTCYGEAVDTVRGDAADLIAFVRDRRCADERDGAQPML